MTTPTESADLKSHMPAALRNEDLDELAMLSSAIQFAPGSRVLDESMRKALEPMRKILDSYSKPAILVVVATNEFENKDRNRVLSQERGRAIIAQLVSQGLLFSQFSIVVSDSEEILPSSHTVAVTITEKNPGR
jgi:outer membrane protein OmpA-like peptidoglycan-associated protein